LPGYLTGVPLDEALRFQPPGRQRVRLRWWRWRRRRMLHSSGVVRSSLGSSVLMTPATCKSATLPAQFCPAHQVFVLGPTCQTCIFFGCRVHTLIRACVETGFLYLKKPAFSWFLRVAGNTLYKTTTKKSVCPFIISISIYHPVIETPTSQLLFILYSGPGTKLSFFLSFLQ
jgi:hypothetical protein